jgi:hypothetical protein
MLVPTYLLAAPMRASVVKRAYGSGPVAIVLAAGLGLTVFWIFG